MPWNLIDQLPPGWRVQWKHTGRGGLCIWRHRLILVDPGMLWRNERCILTHEAVHAQRGPFPRWMRAREEEAVSRMAARHLIPFQRLLDAVCWSQDPHEVADELDVDLSTLEARVRGLHPSERAALTRKLDDL